MTDDLAQRGGTYLGPDAGAPQYTLSHRFAAAPEVVFDAWIDPRLMQRWLFKSDDNLIVRIESDPRVGGRFSILELNQGDLIDHYGYYREIERPSVLSFSLEVPKHFPGVTEIRVDIQPDLQGVGLTFRQRGVAPQIVKESWQLMLQRLERMIS